MIFPEVKIFENKSYEDHRGELYTIFNQKEHDLIFNHDKVSISNKNVLRGLHGDHKSWKLITCLQGTIYFVVVDNRKESHNYLKWDSLILSDKNRLSVLIPPNFANGHYVISEKAIFFYKWSYKGEYPDVSDQFSLLWNDPIINITWPCNYPILSDRDKGIL